MKKQNWTKKRNDLKNKIRLLAFTPPYPSLKGYQDYAACGFDIALIDPIGNFGSPESLKPFEYCEQVGIVGVPMSVGWDDPQSPTTYVQFPRPYDKTDYSKINSFYGVYLWDEPNMQYWPILRNNIHTFQEIYPDHTPIINITVCYAAKELLAEYPLDEEGYGHDCVRATARKYCEEILDEIKGERILMFDYYPLNIGPDGNELIHDYLWGYDELAVLARDRGYSLFSFVQTTGLGESEFGHGRPLTSPADYRFQCMIALAYGCVGIGSFCYQSFFKPEMALADLEELQPTYFLVQKVNREINKFSKTYMKYKWKKAGLNITKTPFKYSLTTLKRMIYNECDYRDIEVKSLRYDTVIGEFEKKDGKGSAYMLVNYIEPSDKKKNHIVLQLKKDVKQVKVWQRGNCRIKTVENGQIELILSTGEGAFIEIKD